ncbi:hypothetical protein BIW11_09003, partial [Tropilaelaps mercedesae]
AVPNQPTVQCVISVSLASSERLIRPKNSAQSKQQLSLRSGDTIEVLRVLDSVMLEGRNRNTGHCGLFPAVCVALQGANQPSPGRSDPNDPEGRIPRGRSPKGPHGMSAKMFGEPRTVVLHKGKKGFGFVLRGAK